LRFPGAGASFIVVIAALLGATEVGLRTLDFPALRLSPLEMRAGYLHDPELGWMPAPNSEKRQTASRTVTLKHNSLGLRDIEFTRGAGPTILFLGTSFVYGIEVEAEERFSERLRSDLPGVRIVNAGIPGYSTDQQYLLLRRLWPHIQPNIVVLLFGSNDRNGTTTNYVFHAFKPYLEEVEGRWQFGGVPVPRSAIQIIYQNWFARHSALVRLAVLAVWSDRKHARSGPDRSEQLVSMMRDFAQGHGAQFLVGLLSHDKRMEQFLVRQKIPSTTLDGAEVYPAWGRHWTPAGHIFVAERLKTFLVTEGLLLSTAARR
jgi:hypothetical protein